jgi:hypothetical protein
MATTDEATGNPGKGKIRIPDLVFGTTTLEEHGQRLTHGPFTPFVFRQPKARIRQELGTVSARVDLRNLPGVAAMLQLGIALQSIGGDDFTKMNEADRIVRLGQLHQADLAQLAQWWAVIRYRGKLSYPYRFTCSKCGTAIPEGDAEVDLGKVEIKTYDPAQNGGLEPYIDLGLHEPWEISPGRKVEWIRLTHPHVIRSIEPCSNDEWNNPALNEISLVAASIDQADGERVTVDRETVLEMLEFDLAGAAKAVAMLEFGPVASVKWTHEVCGHTLRLPASWKADFFG